MIVTPASTLAASRLGGCSLQQVRRGGWRPRSARVTSPVTLAAYSCLDDAVAAGDRTGALVSTTTNHLENSEARDVALHEVRLLQRGLRADR
jgi:hypothetical protein